MSITVQLCCCSAVGRTEPNLDDLGLAFDELHITLSELRGYVENVESKPFAHDVIAFPTPKTSCLQPVEQEHITETKDGLGPSASQTELEGIVLSLLQEMVVSGKQMLSTGWLRKVRTLSVLFIQPRIV